MPNTKTDNFLNAIKKYAKLQKDEMQGEVKHLKSERLKEAREKAERDCQDLVNVKLSETKNRHTVMLAEKTRESRQQLFLERAKMMDEIFSSVTEKLVTFTKTPDYHQYLLNSAKKIAEVFGENDCVLYLGAKDEASVDEIKACFSGNVEVKTDNTIRIGGLKGYCESLGVIADETLDEKLMAQREWFVENAKLSVL